MPPRGPKVTRNQRLIMLDFMEAHPELVSGRLDGDFTKAVQERLWMQLTDRLNVDGTGPTRDLKKWKKSWADWKSETKGKAAAIKRSQGGTGGGQKTPLELTDLEQRLLDIIGPLCVEGDPQIPELGFPLQNVASGSSNLNTKSYQNENECGQYKSPKNMNENIIQFKEAANGSISFELVLPSAIGKVPLGSDPTVEENKKLPNNSTTTSKNTNNVEQDNPNEKEEDGPRRKKRRHARTENNENYERATETLKEMENEKNIIFKSIQSALEERNIIERERNAIKREKANSLGNLSVAILEIAKHIGNFTNK